MNLEEVLARVRQLETMPLATAAPPAPPPSAFDALLAGARAAPLAASAVAPSTLASLLTALELAQPAAAPIPGATGAGPRLLAAAQSQVGQGEQPPGSNDGPAIALYRSAVAGSLPGDPWCAEFVSWAAAQAGAPLGDGGAGFRSVAALTDWAARTGRLLPASSTPQPGDLILFGDRHVGIVEAVEPNGTIDTVEGNYANAVSRVRRSPAEATGFVRL